jgi:hypothetical protein
MWMQFVLALSHFLSIFPSWPVELRPNFGHSDDKVHRLLISSYNHISTEPYNKFLILMKVVLLLWSNFDTDLRTRVRSVVIKT